MGFGEGRPLQLGWGDDGDRQPEEGGERLHLRRWQRPPSIAVCRHPAQHIEHVALHQHPVPDETVLAGCEPGGDRGQRSRRGRRGDRRDRPTGQCGQGRHQRLVLDELVPPEPVDDEHDDLVGVAHRFGKPRRQRGRPVARAEQRRHDSADIGTEVVRNDRLWLGVHCRTHRSPGPRVAGGRQAAP